MLAQISYLLTQDRYPLCPHPPFEYIWKSPSVPCLSPSAGSCIHYIAPAQIFLSGPFKGHHRWSPRREHYLFPSPELPALCPAWCLFAFLKRAREVVVACRTKKSSSLSNPALPIDSWSLRLLVPKAILLMPRFSQGPYTTGRQGILSVLLTYSCQMLRAGHDHW